MSCFEIKAVSWPVQSGGHGRFPTTVVLATAGLHSNYPRDLGDGVRIIGASNASVTRRSHPSRFRVPHRFVPARTSPASFSQRIWFGSNGQSVSGMIRHLQQPRLLSNWEVATCQRLEEPSPTEWLLLASALAMRRLPRTRKRETSRPDQEANSFEF